MSEEERKEQYQETKNRKTGYSFIFTYLFEFTDYAP